MSERSVFTSSGRVQAVADCAPAPTRGTALFPRPRPAPVKLPPRTPVLDSGFISGHLSPTTPPAAAYRYPKEAAARPLAGEATSRLSVQLSGLQLEEPALEGRERAAWERRYIALLEEAFRGDEDGDT